MTAAQLVSGIFALSYLGVPMASRSAREVGRSYGFSWGSRPRNHSSSRPWTRRFPDQSVYRALSRGSPVDGVHARWGCRWTAEERRRTLLELSL